MATPRHYYLLALAHAQQNNITNAAAFARSALTLDPNDTNARKLYALCLYRLGYKSAAAAAAPEYSQAIDAAADEKIYARVRALVEKRKWRSALKQLRGSHGQNARAQNICGCLSIMRGKSATQNFANALQYDAVNAPAQRYIAQAPKSKRSWTFR